jgi:hypothetical protein
MERNFSFLILVNLSQGVRAIVVPAKEMNLIYS